MLRIHKTLQGCVSVHIFEGVPRLQPQGHKYAIRPQRALAYGIFSLAIKGIHGAVKKADDFQRGYLGGRAGKHKAPGLAPAAFHKAALTQLVENIFKESRGNGLRCGNVLDTRWRAARAAGKFKKGAQPVLAFKRNAHDFSLLEQ